MRCMPVVSFNGSRNDLQLIKPYLAAIYGTYGAPWFRRFRAYEGPELSAALMVCHLATGVRMR